MSEIVDIYTALAGETVTAGGVAVTAVAPEDLPTGFIFTELPKRYLLPFGMRPIREVVQFPLDDEYIEAPWQVTDLLLWASAKEGIGPSAYAAALVEYRGAYVQMVQGLALPTPANKLLDNVTITTGVVEWPPRSGTYYYGAECVLTVREFMW